MRRLLIILLLLPLALAGCIIEPGRGYDRGYWGGRGHGEWHEDRGRHGDFHGDRGRY